MKKLGLVLVLLALAAFFFFYRKSNSNVLKVGIVLPMQHQALDDIVNGFKNELTALLVEMPIHIEVQNAMNDINLQKSAINKFLNEKVDLLVPVAKGTAQMALSLAPKQQAVLFLAAYITPDSAIAKEKPGLMGVIDEIPVALQLKFIRTALPEVKKITIIYSSSDKNFDDAQDFIKAAHTDNLAVQKLMVQNLSELYTVSSRIEADSQAIFILKDNLVASGINTLVQQANTLKVPLITSDEGTIKGGGAFALGVVEADVGRQGAKIAALYFQKAVIETPIQYLSKISVFINKASCETQGLNIEAINRAAAAMGLSIVDE